MASSPRGISQSEVQILQAIYHEALENGTNRIRLEDIYKKIVFHRPSEEQLIGSIRLLRDHGYLDARYDTEEAFEYVEINSRCFEEYARDYRNDYYQLYTAVPEKIINERLFKSEDIASSLEKPIIVINLVLDYFIQHNFMKADHRDCSNIHICEICPPFKRLFKKR